MYVVGIGASVDGLSPLKEFFSIVRPDLGVAFVVVQALAADHRSLMPEILSRLTAMRVREVEDEVTVTPNEIYLAPPGTHLELRGDRLQVADRAASSPAQPETPMDGLFRSLAEGIGNRAVGIVFSGAGKDGVEGARAIYEAGGVVLVQGPEAADPDRRRSATIPTQHSHLVGAPGELADAVHSIVSPRPATRSDSTASESSASSDVGVLLRAIEGLNAELEERSAAQRALEGLNRSLASTVSSRSEELEKTVDQLTRANRSLQDTNSELRAEAESRAEAQLRLAERVRELQCLYEVTEAAHSLADSEAIFAATARALRAAMAEEKLAGARVRFDDCEAAAGDVDSRGWAIGSPLLSAGGERGVVELISAIPREEPNPFSDDDRALVREVAHRLSTVVARRDAEEDAKSSLRRLELALSAGGGGTWVWDIGSNDVDFDPYLQAMFGMPEGGFGGTYESWRELVHPDDVAAAETAVTTALEGGPPYDVYYRVYGKDGSFRHLRSMSVLVRDAKGEPREMVGVCFDVTKTKEIERALQESERQSRSNLQNLARNSLKLRRANEELEQFAYAASHDLLAPLRGIGNLASWLEEDLEDVLSPDAKEKLDLLQGRVARLQRLLDGILEYSRAGRDRLAVEVVDSRAEVEALEALLDLPPGFELRIGDDLPTFETARPPFQQVLLNLIGNAVKHHDRPGGRIDVRCVDEGDHFRFEVQDDGPGIPADLHEKAFRMFHTLQPRDQREGSGLGLSLVKRHVERLGGTIRVDSGTERGTTIAFTWPKAIAGDDV